MIVRFDKFRILSLAMLVVMAVMSCNKPDGGSTQQKPDPTPTPTPTPTPSIVIDSGVDTKPILSEDGGDFKISFESTVSWTASVVESKADLSWVTLDRTSGPAGHVSIGVTVSANESYSARSAIVRIVAGSKVQDITITQRAKEDRTVKVTGVSLKVDGSAEITEGETVTIIATVLPENATNKNVSWTSSSSGVASVNDGVVTGLKAGTTRITAKTEDGGLTASCQITVKEAVVNVQSISIDGNGYATVTEGETLTLKATVLPENATNKNVSWASSDNSVATVQGGVVTAIKPGTATVTVTTEDGGYTASCQVTVEKSPVPVEFIVVEYDTDRVSIGETITLRAVVYPEDATDRDVVWMSENESVATVSDGVVTGISEGTAFIRVTSQDGSISAGCWIYVIDPIIHVSYVSIETIERGVIGIGETSVLTVHVYPEDATNKNVIWTSSNENVASVADGVVTGVSAGTAEITVTAEDGGAFATWTIRVEVPVESLTFDITSATLNVGETLTIKATVLPEDATNREITWYSGNTEIATVEDGVVTALKQGDVWIMASCAGVSNSCYVRVVNPNLVNFNDWQFKEFCVENFDLDNDGEISLDEAAAVKEIDYTTPNWVNLSDIKYFVNLESLKVISTLTDGYYTLGGHGAIAELNKLKHLELQHFGIFGNSFNISNLADLEYLDIHDCNLNFLDVSKNKKLKYLDCSPMMYDTLEAIAIYKGQNIPNVTVDPNPDYIPPYTKIYVEGSVVAGGNEGTREGDEI